jgi:arsenite-transporting ATPase
MPPFALLDSPPRFLFFTGKGGVGKTSLSAAMALALAGRGKRVLLVSTDAASNLDEMLGVPLSNRPVPVPGAPGLQVLNIDPHVAAEHYRARVLAQLPPAAGDDEVASVREQLSGACTTEIATFDEFATLLADTALPYEHVVFDTAPTGHTLRLLSLPRAWSGFLQGNDRGASCLGPHSGLKMQESLFNTALAALSDPTQTTVVLVTRPEQAALEEAGRTAGELQALGLVSQQLVINAVFTDDVGTDPVAVALQAQQSAALAALPATLRGLVCTRIPLRAVDSVGLAALRSLLAEEAPAPPPPSSPPVALPPLPGLAQLVERLVREPRGLVLVMGKGGVGKTTVAAALALALLRAGKSVHLTTTDPAAHLAMTLAGEVEGLVVSRIDPKLETRRYIDKVLAARGPGLSAAELALLQEDLKSPCTEEVAVFHAFSHLVSQARGAFVVMDTAPTGHSLLLMDAAGAYHRQVLRGFDDSATGKVITPLMRLQDASYTKLVLVTLPESTPVSQAIALQDDLRRARIEPFAWVINRSLLATGTQHPLLQARLQVERRQIARVVAASATPPCVVPWQPVPPVGVAALAALLG